jgi:phenylalanyl-tRNA synthetase beta chain
MLLSLKWLREFTPYEGTPEDLAAKLTMLGNEVEEIKNPFAALSPMVVGHVVECGRHPEAEKLSVCRVDVGAEVLDIVCGAPNVAAGQKVPVAKVGAVMPDGMEIKKAKLRGAPSHGMICSERELGLSEDHSGIMVLDPALVPGTPLITALDLETVVLDVSITPNRADCLSTLGLARETAAAFGLPLTLPKPQVREAAEKATDQVRIEIADGGLCPLYMGRIIRGVKIGPSPAWLRYRLLSVGQRPISNVVDATNYVMMELGQPQHAFDLNLLEGGKIRVAPAPEGLKFKTLDNQERLLTAADLLIWDGAKPVALAGVMGGSETEISAATTDVLLECAVFRPGTIRKTARRLGLPSEASYRFERGVDQVGSRLAMERGAALLAELSGGTILSGIAQAEPKPWATRVIPFRPARCTSLLGLELTPDFCRQALTGLGCAVEGDGPEWQVTAPSWRLDLEREVDLIEEAARLNGVDRIPSVVPRVSKSSRAKALMDTEFGFIQALKNWGVAAGFREAVNYSFVGGQDLDALHLPQEGRVPIANPLSEDQNVLRTRLAPGLLHTLRQNVSQGTVALRIFEVARTFHADPSSETGAREKNTLALLLHGPRRPETWPWSEEAKEQTADYQDARGAVEHLLDECKLGPAEFTLGQDHPYLEPVVRVTLAGQELGEIGRVKADIAGQYLARKEVWVAELDADLLRAMKDGRAIAFRALPVYPPVRRDCTFFCPAALPMGDIEKALAGLKAPLLEEVKLVAVFTPEEGGEQRNLSFRFTYRHKERTLKDKEVDKEHQRLLTALKDKLGVGF